MLVTRDMLIDLGAKNVVVMNTPAIIVNGGVAVVKETKYNSLDEIKLANWFVGDTTLMIYEGSKDDSSQYVVRLYDFSKWAFSFVEEPYSPLTMHKCCRSE